ncbi:uncharacterized protein LOC125376712 [Haliotis rufescens]|uniref:uncharacterized protein LOC125376712 n=1 Tax=Haliotis rufescens TaxID=6454 RepID=UPI00201EBB88|nr:uncharacterized protein LOC125376712 [Haliotis rufescens]
MLDYFSYNSEEVGFAVEFENVAMTDTVMPKKLRCAIRPKGDQYGGSWHTTETTPFVASAGPRGGSDPDYEDFVVLQRIFYEAIIKHFNPNSIHFYHPYRLAYVQRIFIEKRYAGLLQSQF